MKSLVTGAAGFIGSHLSEKLINEGHKVIGIDCFIDYYSKKIKENNMKKLLKNKNFKFINKNIINLNLKELLKDVDYIFHQAAQAGVRASWGKSFEIYSNNNIFATQKILEAAKNSEIDKFVYASSSSVYGELKSLPMKEDDKLKPLSPYGVSKLAAENLCYLYYKNFKVPTISLRYFTVYGERQRPDMAFHIFGKALLNNQPIYVFGDGKQSRNFTHVDDIIAANLLAANSKHNGEVYNIGGDKEGISINQTLKFMQDYLKISGNITYDDKVKGDVKHTSADISKAKIDLNYNPKIDFKHGLKRELDWLKDLYK